MKIEEEKTRLINLTFALQVPESDMDLLDELVNSSPVVRDYGELTSVALNFLLLVTRANKEATLDEERCMREFRIRVDEEGNFGLVGVGDK